MGYTSGARAQDAASTSEVQPSKSMYHFYLSRSTDGSDEHKVLADLGFFKWMHETYGMQLEYFLLDAGRVGLKADSMSLLPGGVIDPVWLNQHFPDHFKRLLDLASSFGCHLKLAIHCPEVNTVPALSKRIISIARFCKEYDLGLIKLGDQTDPRELLAGGEPDTWEDNFVYQAFNRNNLFVPEIFKDPWLLKENEFPELARIVNVYQQYKDILYRGKSLPAARFGLNAVSRGNDDTRLLTFRNTTANAQRISFRLDSTIGIIADGTFLVKQLFPRETYLGRFTLESTVEVQVEAFHTALFLITLHSSRVDIRGCSYETITDIEGKPVVVRLIGQPGQRVRLSWGRSSMPHHEAWLGSVRKPSFFQKGLKFRFPGRHIQQIQEHILGEMVPQSISASITESIGKNRGPAGEISTTLPAPSTIPEVEFARRSLIPVNNANDQHNLHDREPSFSKADMLYGPEKPGHQAWNYFFKVRKASLGSFLAIHLPDTYLPENFIAAILDNGKIMERSSGLKPVQKIGNLPADHILYIPIRPSMWKKKLELILVNRGHKPGTINPELWLSPSASPVADQILTLK